MYYVYVHYRKDNGVPFYVGKGCGKRAYADRGRNEHWKRVKRKHGIFVCLWFTGLTEEEAFVQERILINQFRAIFPRSLVNVTDGGEGASRLDVVSQSQEEAITWLRRMGRMPCQYVKEEAAIFYTIHRYTNPNRTHYNGDLHILAVSNGMRENGSALRKQEIIEFCLTRGRFPGPKDALYTAFKNYTCPLSGSFDPSIYAMVVEANRGRYPKRRSRTV